MAVKILITLEGSEQVKAAIDDVVKHSEGLAQTVNDIGKDTELKSPFKDISLQLQNAKPALEGATEATHRFREAIHVLHPILRAAGIEISAFGGFSRAAGAGILGLGTAIAGGIVVSLARLEEGAAKVRGQLSDLFPTGQGAQAFELLNKQAKQFGTTVEGLAPGLEALQTALNNVDRTAQGFVALRAEDRPGGNLQNVKAVTDAYDNFIKILRAGRLTQDEAQKSAEAFFKTMRDGGQVTSAALRELPAGTITLLKDALGAAGLTAKQFFAAVEQGVLPVDRLVAVLAQFGPQAQKAFDTKAIKTIGDEVGSILNDLTTGFERLSGTTFSQFIITQLERIRQAVKDTIQPGQDLADTLQEIRDQARRRLIPPEITGEIPLPIPRPAEAAKAGEEAAKQFGKGFILASQSLQQLGAAGVQTGQQIAQGANQAAQAYTQLKERVDEFGNSMEEAGRGGQAFKGRLDTIPVFVPQLAGQGGPAAQAGQTAGKTFVDNFNTELKADLVPEKLPPLQLLIEPPSTAELEAAALPAGERFFTKLKEGIDSQPPPEFPGIIQGLDNLGNIVLDKAQQMWASLNQILSQPITLNFQAPSGDFAFPFASGGLVRGPGSSTSDSIPAWLSNNEFIVNARAVSYYGSELLHLINTMRLPRGIFPGFNMGGLVNALSAAMPKFADGGQVSTSQLQPVTVVIGQQKFDMRASGDTIKALSRFAVNSQLTSAGRKPSWVR